MKQLSTVMYTALIFIAGVGSALLWTSEEITGPVVYCSILIIFVSVVLMAVKINTDRE